MYKSANKIFDPFEFFLKKKKKKHVQVILREYNVTAVDDTRIRRILKEWSMEESKTCQKLT